MPSRHKPNVLNDRATVPTKTNNALQPHLAQVCIIGDFGSRNFGDHRVLRHRRATPSQGIRNGRKETSEQRPNNKIVTNSHTFKTTSRRGFQFFICLTESYEQRSSWVSLLDLSDPHSFATTPFVRQSTNIGSAEPRTRTEAVCSKTRTMVRFFYFQNINSTQGQRGIYFTHANDWRKSATASNFYHRAGFSRF